MLLIDFSLNVTKDHHQMKNHPKKEKKKKKHLMQLLQKPRGHYHQTLSLPIIRGFIERAKAPAHPPMEHSKNL
jgi:hypothetical protein